MAMAEASSETKRKAADTANVFADENPRISALSDNHPSARSLLLELFIL